MTIIKQLKRAIEAYDGPLPAVGDTVEEVWFRQTVKQLWALQGQFAVEFSLAAQRIGGGL